MNRTSFLRAAGIVSVLAVMVQTGWAQELPGSGVTVRPIKGDSDTSTFQHLVVQRGLEALGYTVAETQLANYPTIHLAIAGGDADYTVHHWQPLHDSFYESAGGQGVMTRIGNFSPDITQGYLIDKKTADELGIDNISQLADPKVAAKFDADGDGKANLVGCNPGWGCERIVEHHLTAYKLRNTIEHDQGEYLVLLADMLERRKQGQSIFYYTWSPNWIGSELRPGTDVVWLNVPFSAGPDGDVDTASPNGSNTGFPLNTIRVLANNEFLDNNLAAKKFLELVTVPVADIEAQNFLIQQGEKSAEDIERHTTDWIARNQAAFDGWVDEAKKAAN